jgi:SAM-dependent methyltransferase
MGNSVENRLEGELSACPACSAAPIEHLHWGVGGGKTEAGARVFFVSGCKACGLVFTNPPPTADELAAAYGEHGAWNERSNESTASPPDPTNKTTLPRKDCHLRRVLEAAPCEHPYALDFGCGEGEFLNELAIRGWRVCGIDPATKHVLSAWHEMRDEIPATPTFDVIIAKHVLEHLPNPLAILRAFRAALKPNGVIYIGVPCLDDAEAHGKLDYCINKAHHITGYTDRSLRHLMRAAGLEPTRSFRDGTHYRFAMIARPALTPLRAIFPDADPLASARAVLAKGRTEDAIASEAFACAEALAYKRRKKAKRAQLVTTSD